MKDTKKETIADIVKMLHPDMADRLRIYAPAWEENKCDMMENCECIVSGCILDGECCEEAFDLFNTLGDCRLSV
jgi:hypothetical protein